MTDLSKYGFSIKDLQEIMPKVARAILEGNAKLLPGEDSYDPPPDGWVCFHCGVRFMDEHLAYEHFGRMPTAKPACQVTRKELREYRELERMYGMLNGRNRELWRKFHEKDNNGKLIWQAPSNSWGFNRAWKNERGYYPL